MNEPKTVSISSVGYHGEPRRVKKMTLAGVLLISIWVAGYALVLVAFQFAKVLDRILSRGSVNSCVSNR
jgi:hypothetical protein